MSSSFRTGNNAGARYNNQGCRININDYFNEVKDDTNNLPIWVKDVNDIDRKIDPRAVDYHRRWRDRLRGDWFLARFVNDIESRFKMIVRWFSNDEKVY